MTFIKSSAKQSLLNRCALWKSLPSVSLSSLKSLLSLLSLLSLTTHTAAQSPVPAQSNADPATIVQGTLLADTTALQPNTTLTLGVLFKIQPGWHIYWRYPGASGLGTTVQWGLPNGVTAGETLYPVPISFESPGPVISYGYDGEVLLLTEARTGDLLPDSGEVEITAKNRWLMCSDRCMPGKKDLTLKLPIGKGSPANQELFAKYKKLLPRRVAALPSNIKASAKGDAKKMALEISIIPPTGQKIVGADKLPGLRKPYFFPFDQKGIVFEAPTASAPTGDADSIKVHEGPAVISYTAEAGSADSSQLNSLNGVLVYQTTNPQGKTSPPEILEIDAKTK